MSGHLLQRTPLDDWLRRKLGLSSDEAFTLEKLAAHQLDRLRATVAHARGNSPFYRDRLAGLPPGFPSRLDDIARLPFTTADDLRENHLAMLCVSQSRVARVKTLRTSGTTAPRKRVYFSESDLELTLDFFHHGMSTMVGPGDTVLILLPGSTPDSVGDLLARGLARMEVRGVVHGPVIEPATALVAAEEARADCLVGIPVQVLAMADHQRAGRLRGLVKSVLLTTDYVPQNLATRVRRAWGCQVFEHYGITETGLGGGVDCRAHAGYHLRAADLYYEAVDPASGALLPVGQKGELVVTTLTRQALPLIRYRTNDLGRLLAGACPCGGITPRLERVSGRLDNRLDLGGRDWLPMWQLDEVLFGLPELLDYRAGLFNGSQHHRLEIQVQALHGSDNQLSDKVKDALGQIPALALRFAAGDLVLGKIKISHQAWAVDGSSKRTFYNPD
jgi:phenylacetate-coenzyme A ligase PaaK-like adenylate-forming protein